MPSRSDFITQTGKTQEYFSDFLVNLDKSPLTDDLGRVTNEDAVKQSMQLLVLTMNGEVPHNRDRGSQVQMSLFDNYGPFTADDIVQSIKSCLTQNEPRAQIIDVTAGLSEDQNYISISVVFLLINNPDPISFSFMIQRVR